MSEIAIRLGADVLHTFGIRATFMRYEPYMIHSHAVFTINNPNKHARN